MTMAASSAPAATGHDSARARNFQAVVLATMVVVTGILLMLAISRPELLPRALRTVTIVNALGAALLVLGRRSTRAASALFVAGLVSLVTFNALSGGGIRSPGVTAYLLFPLMAGVLLGARAAVVTAAVCATLGFALVAAGWQGILVQTAQYDELALWMLNCIYMGVSIVLVHTATGNISTALRRAEEELAARKIADEERRAVESQLRQSQKMEALGRLAGGIAHDFNNILTAIGGNAAMAAPLAPPGPVRESLDEIVKANARATALVQQVLTFSRHRETVRKVMLLQPVVEEALTLVRGSLGSGIRLRTSFAADLPPIEGDATQIHQVVMNLATNAADAMRRFGGVLTVSAERLSVEEGDPALAAGVYVCLHVEDTGMGMTTEVRERVFEPFFSTKGDQGTGLGLAVVYGIVREHGGSIAVDSEPGKGTTFTVCLPALP